MYIYWKKSGIFLILLRIYPDVGLFWVQLVYYRKMGYCQRSALSECTSSSSFVLRKKHLQVLQIIVLMLNLLYLFICPSCIATLYLVRKKRLLFKRWRNTFMKKNTGVGEIWPGNLSSLQRLAQVLHEIKTLEGKAEVFLLLSFKSAIYLIIFFLFILQYYLRLVVLK